MKTSQIKNYRQQRLINDGYRSLAYGGELRKRRQGRTARPLSLKKSHHIVFKINRLALINRSFRHPKNFVFVRKLMGLYAKRFFIKIESISYQHDHIHIMARSSRRSHFHAFFRVFSGQIAQNLKVARSTSVTDTPGNSSVTATPKLWRHRPFTRIVKSWTYRKKLIEYILLNEMEVTGIVSYKKDRTRNLSEDERMWLLMNSA